jgi:hypothetical protein
MATAKVTFIAVSVMLAGVMEETRRFAAADGALTAREPLDSPESSWSAFQFGEFCGCLLY